MTDTADDDHEAPGPTARVSKGTKKTRAGKTPKSQPSRLATVERLLLTTVEPLKDGQPTKMTTLEAIMHRLVQKSLGGSKKADRAIELYEAHAQQHSPSKIEIVFVDNEYTRAFAASKGNDDV